MLRLPKSLQAKLNPPIRIAPRTHIKTLIFDFDGTLADTSEAGLEILNKLAGELGYRRIDRHEAATMRGMNTFQAMRFMQIPIRRMSLLARRGCEELSARIDSIHPFPGVPETLHYLRSREFRLGIVSSNTESNVRKFLRNHGLEIFEFLRISKVMGKAHVLRCVLKEFRLNREEVLTVGDEIRDIEAAYAARVPIAAVCSGYATRSALEKRKPSLIMDHLTELPTLLDRLLT